jgi:type IV pilus assembly protein PilC
MSTFKYIAKTSEARNISGKIAADSKTAVIEELRKRKLTIISVDEVKEAAQAKSTFQSKKVKTEEIVIFVRQLATMVDAGIPILQGLDALQDQVTHPLFKKIFNMAAVFRPLLQSILKYLIRFLSIWSKSVRRAAFSVRF